MVIKIVNRLEILHPWFISFVTYLPLLAEWLIQVYACNTIVRNLHLNRCFLIYNILVPTQYARKMCTSRWNIHNASLSRSLIRSSLVSMENGNSVKLNETKSCKWSYLENVKWLEFHWKYENHRMIQLSKHATHSYGARLNRVRMVTASHHQTHSLMDHWMKIPSGQQNSICFRVTIMQVH